MTSDLSNIPPLIRAVDEAGPFPDTVIPTARSGHAVDYLFAASEIT
jgi:hypothetical protein